MDMEVTAWTSMYHAMHRQQDRRPFSKATLKRIAQLEIDGVSLLLRKPTLEGLCAAHSTALQLIEAGAEPDGSGYEATLAGDDEDVLSTARVNDRVARNGEGRTGLDLERGTAVDARTKRAVSILDREADSQGPGSLGQRWIEELDPRLEGLTARGRELEPGDLERPHLVPALPGALRVPRRERMAEVPALRVGIALDHQNAGHFSRR